MKKEEMIEQLKKVTNKLKDIDGHSYFSQFFPIHYEYGLVYSRNKKEAIKKLEERNVELVNKLRSSFTEMDRLNSEIVYLRNLISSASREINEIIKNSEEKRTVYTLETKNGTELRINLPELVASNLEEYELIKTSEEVYRFEKVTE
jgi:chaperonin cofactor prefoldin